MREQIAMCSIQFNAGEARCARLLCREGELPNDFVDFRFRHLPWRCEREPCALRHFDFHARWCKGGLIDGR